MDPEEWLESGVRGRFRTRWKTTSRSARRWPSRTRHDAMAGPARLYRERAQGAEEGLGERVDRSAEDGRGKEGLRQARAVPDQEDRPHDRAQAAQRRGDDEGQEGRHPRHRAAQPACHRGCQAVLPRHTPGRREESPAVHAERRGQGEELRQTLVRSRGSRRGAERRGSPCSHAMLHCHMGVDSLDKGGQDSRVPLPWLDPDEALAWVLATLDPRLEPVSIA